MSNIMSHCFIDPLIEPYPHQFATALFSFLYHLASYDAGGEALVSCGMMEALLKVCLSIFTIISQCLLRNNCIYLFYFEGDQVFRWWARSNHLCDESSAGCGSDNKPRHGCLSIPQRPFNFHLQARGELKRAFLTLLLKASCLKNYLSFIFLI